MFWDAKLKIKVQINLNILLCITRSPKLCVIVLEVKILK